MLQRDHRAITAFVFIILRKPGSGTMDEESVDPKPPVAGMTTLIRSSLNLMWRILQSRLELLWSLSLTLQCTVKVQSCTPMYLGILQLITWTPRGPPLTSRLQSSLGMMFLIHRQGEGRLMPSIHRTAAVQ